MILSFKFLSDNPRTDIGVLSVMGYVLFTLIPYATAGRYFCAGLMLVALLVNLIRHRFVWQKPDWLSGSLYALVLVALLSTVLSSDPKESFNVVRKDALPFLIGFLLLTQLPRDTTSKQRIVAMACATVILAYAFRTIMAFCVDVDTGFKFSLYKQSPELPRYLDFYAADSLYYVPMLFAAILFADISKSVRIALASILAIALFEVSISGVRTSFVLISLTMLILLAARFWNYRKYMALSLLVALLAAYVAKDYVTNPTLARYYTLVDLNTYKFGEDFSVSERAAIASAVTEISRQKPLLGYGPGWAKLPAIAKEEGLLAKWQASSQPIDQMKYRYFSLGVGRVNPHNMYLALFFELGALGVLVYLSLLFSVLVFAINVLRASGVSPVRTTVGFAAVCYIIVYLISGFAGGPWAPALLLVFAVSLEILREKPGRLNVGHG